jgi:hypothetical protein
MKPAALLFFVLLALAHVACGRPAALHQPLCSFREGEAPTLGYALFCAIALVGAIYALAMRRGGLPGEAANVVGSGLLLAIVAATPSTWALHNAAALVLMGSIFAHYAILLLDERAWLYVHLAMPLVLAAATRLESYGLWQKALICYLVAVAVAHHHIVQRRGRKGIAAEKATWTSRELRAAVHRGQSNKRCLRRLA